jgi:nicotinamide-nucleotide amidase
VIVELINTGAELMLGRVLNSHQQWLCRELSAEGLLVQRQVAVSDKASDIGATLRESLSRADLIVTTGGLGPTSDDLTRDAVANLLGLKLRVDAETLAKIEAFFASRGRPIPESTKVQALVPEGCTVIPNANGTAPGLAIEVAPNPFRASGGSSLILMLPGPPRELRPMFRDEVIPLLKKRFPDRPNVFWTVLKTTGVGESILEEKISPILKPLLARGLDLGYCARIGDVEIRLGAEGANCRDLVAEAELLVRGELGGVIYASGEELIEQTVVNELTRRGNTLSAAESCTGGLIAHRITNVPGASAVFLAGLVTYSNEAKIRLLGVKAETLEKFGAVSAETAREMAIGARERQGTDFSVAVTGIAGPGGGSAEKPVGTVYIAVAAESRVKARHFVNGYDRETFKQVTSQQALDLVRTFLR